jgi:hypothetical protein
MFLALPSATALRCSSCYKKRSESVNFEFTHIHSRNRCLHTSMASTNITQHSVWLTWLCAFIVLQVRHQLPPSTSQRSGNAPGQPCAVASLSSAGQSKAAALMHSQCALPLDCTICIAAVTVLCAISAEPSSTPLPLLRSCKASRAKGGQGEALPR